MLGVGRRRRERKDLKRKKFEAESCLAPKRQCESKATGANTLVWDTPEVHSSLFQVRICYMCSSCRKLLYPLHVCRSSLRDVNGQVGHTTSNRPQARY